MSIWSQLSHIVTYNVPFPKIEECKTNGSSLKTFIIQKHARITSWLVTKHLVTSDQKLHHQTNCNKSSNLTLQTSHSLCATLSSKVD